MEELFQEFELVGITTLSAPPRLYDFIFSQFKAALADALESAKPDEHDTIRQKVPCIV